MTRLSFLGSADAFHGGARRHSAYLLEEGDNCVAVDFGPTALLGLRAIDFDPARIDAICLTHLHGDHIAGVPFLLLDGIYHIKRARPILITGPVNTKKRIELLLQATYEDSFSHAPFEINIEEWLPNITTTAGRFRVQTFEADHMDPPHRPLMLRFTTPQNKIIAFSGDTQWCDALIQLAAGADLLVAECTNLSPATTRHCSWKDWFPNLARVGAKKILLSHLGAEMREAIPILLQQISNAKVEIADDGMVVDL